MKSKNWRPPSSCWAQVSSTALYFANVMKRRRRRRWRRSWSKKQRSSISFISFSIHISYIDNNSTESSTTLFDSYSTSKSVLAERQSAIEYKCLKRLVAFPMNMMMLNGSSERERSSREMNRSHIAGLEQKLVRHMRGL